MSGAVLNVEEIIMISCKNGGQLNFVFCAVVGEAVLFFPSPPVSLAASGMKSAMSIEWNVLCHG